MRQINSRDIGDRRQNTAHEQRRAGGVGLAPILRHGNASWTGRPHLVAQAGQQIRAVPLQSAHKIITLFIQDHQLVVAVDKYTAIPSMALWIQHKRNHKLHGLREKPLTPPHRSSRGTRTRRLASRVHDRALKCWGAMHSGDFKDIRGTDRFGLLTHLHQRA